MLKLMGTCQKWVFTLVPIIVGQLFTGSAAEAAENGVTIWTPGLQTEVPALLPPPGATELYNYTQFYNSDHSVDGQGRTIPLKINVDVAANATRIVHTWDFVTSGFNFSSGAIIASDVVRATVGPTTSTNAGVFFIYLTPIYATYQWNDFHFLAGAGVAIPVSSYNPNRIANASANYFAYINEFAVTWLPNPKVEVSLAPNITWNSKNHSTDYISGNMFDLDFYAGVKPLDNLQNLQIGVNGYLVEQFSSDRVAGQNVPGGNNQRKFALGPQITYWLNPAAGLIFKWEHELYVRNGPIGDRFWIEFAFPLGASTASAGPKKGSV
jgi:hypothetical protein